MYRANPPSTIPKQFYRRSVFVPYLNSLISLLENLFFMIIKLRSVCFLVIHFKWESSTRSSFCHKLKNVGELYNIDNFVEEIRTWYDVWLNWRCQNMETADMHLIDLFDYTQNMMTSWTWTISLSFASYQATTYRSGLLVGFFSQLRECNNGSGKNPCS